MAKIFIKLFFTISLLGLFACSQETQKAKIRIVDLQGNFKPILTKIPDFNAQVMDGQEFQSSPANRASQEQQSTTIIPEKRQDYSNPQSQPFSQTLNSPTAKTNGKNFDDGQKNNEKNSMIFAGRQDGKIISEYDLANSKDEMDSKENVNLSEKNKDIKSLKPKQIFASKENENKDNAEIAQQKNYTKKYFVQVGSYKSKDVADDELKVMKKFHRGKIEMAESDEQKIYRVLLGPFVNKNQARKVVNKIVNSGHEAILVKGN